MEIPKLKPMPITHLQFLKWNESGDFALKPCTCQNVIAAQAESESRAFERAVKAKIAKANRDRRRGDDR